MRSHLEMDNIGWLQQATFVKTHHYPLETHFPLPLFSSFLVPASKSRLAGHSQHHITSKLKRQEYFEMNGLWSPNYRQNRTIVVDSFIYPIEAIEDLDTMAIKFFPDLYKFLYFRCLNLTNTKWAGKLVQMWFHTIQLTIWPHEAIVSCNCKRRQCILRVDLERGRLGLEVWLKQYSTCFTSMKTWVQTLVPPKKKKKKQKRGG
jgi:hypothetical protein